MRFNFKRIETNKVKTALSVEYNKILFFRFKIQTDGGRGKTITWLNPNRNLSVKFRIVNL